MKNISGGVCAPQGFKASGLHCGMRKNKERRDVALISCDTLCNAAATYTTNRVKAAPVYLNMQNMQRGKMRAVIANSGNANACAPNGMEKAQKMCDITAKALGIAPNEVFVCSTGVIGVELDTTPIEKNIDKLVASLSTNGGDDAANAILTTDTVKKEISLECEIGGKTVKMGAMAKGSGMIHPNMGTMLCFITTDANIESDVLQSALLSVVKRTFNRVSVDGDTSTNDTAVILASGLAGNAPIVENSAEYDAFYKMLFAVCEHLARAIAKDGEGATHLITCTVDGASTEAKAEKLAKSIISSSLTKAAMFGADANWGRVLCAMGYSGEDFEPDEVTISFASKAGEIIVCENGRGLVFDEDLAKKILTEADIEIRAKLSEGNESATVWGCDLTYDYVKINGDYRT